MYTAQTPGIVKALYSDLLWNMPRDRKVLYLTFDDGPIPEVTPFVLDCLAECKAKASFFCIGKNVDEHPHLLERILAAGHTVGNHSQTHLNGWKTPTGDYLSDVEACQTRTGTKLFRPPYGRIKRAQVKALRSQYQIVMWDVLSGDFDQSISVEKCLKNVTDSAQNGSIIVFHDSLKAKLNMEYALPRVLRHFTELGYAFEKL